jgi:hypothetical protein
MKLKCYFCRKDSVSPAGHGFYYCKDCGHFSNYGGMFDIPCECNVLTKENKTSLEDAVCKNCKTNVVNKTALIRQEHGVIQYLCMDCICQKVS